MSAIHSRITRVLICPEVGEADWLAGRVSVIGDSTGGAKGGNGSIAAAIDQGRKLFRVVCEGSLRAATA